MRRAKLSFCEVVQANIFTLVASAILLTVCIPALSVAQQQGQKTFSSAEEAASALIAAAQKKRRKEDARNPGT